MAAIPNEGHRVWEYLVLNIETVLHDIGLVRIEDDPRSLLDFVHRGKSVKIVGKIIRSWGLEPLRRADVGERLRYLVGMYVQDDFKATPGLTVNMGLRYEFITVPTEVGDRLANMDTPLDPALFQGNPYFENPSLKNFSPRIGLAWSPFGDGKTSVRAGFGVFFDQIMTPYFSSPISQSLPNIRATRRFSGTRPA